MSVSLVKWLYTPGVGTPLQRDWSGLLCLNKIAFTGLCKGTVNNYTKLDFSSVSVHFLQSIRTSAKYSPENVFKKHGNAVIKVL